MAGTRSDMGLHFSPVRPIKARDWDAKTSYHESSMSTITNGRSNAAVASTSSTRAWSVHDASELYEVPRWGHHYFSVNAAGHVEVHPTKDPAHAIDLKELVDRLQLRGISLPVLIRFTDILRHRLGEIHTAFQSAI